MFNREYAINRKKIWKKIIKEVIEKYNLHRKVFLLNNQMKKLEN